jgi:hypothetical protein
MSEHQNEPRPLLLDPAAASASPDQPAFLSKPVGAPVYHGFPLIEETCIDGWCFGAITDFQDTSGCTGGDGFVQAPDGSRAGLVWEVGTFPLSEILAPEPDRWGVYYVSFSHPVHNVSDLCDCFAKLLPQLRDQYEKVVSRQIK